MKPCTTHHNACDCREAIFAKLREQNRRMKAAIARAKKCQRYNVHVYQLTAASPYWNYTTADYGRFMEASAVLAALRLRK
jgi:hypothetical protein